MDYSFLVLLSFAVVNCFNKFKNEKLDISLKSDNVGVNYYETYFDNVFYSYYKPKNGTALRSVYDKGTKLWSPLDSYENIRYALVANKDNTPSLLYLLTLGSEGISDEYYHKDDDLWTKVTWFDYNVYLQRLKDTVVNSRISMFLTSADFSPYFDMYNFSGKTEYTFMPVKYGYSCFHVFYKGRIWMSPDKKDRCVAVWAYKVNSEDYNLVRLLVTYENNTSELLTYKFNENKSEDRWEKYNKEEKGMPDLRFADNLIHPEYNFVDKRSEVYFPRPEKRVKEETYIHNEDPQILYFDPYVVNHHVRTNHEYLDDVYYYHYTPKSENMVTKIFCSTQKVWESYLNETVKYALVVNDENGPVMAYLLLKFGDKVNSLFLRKKGYVWSRTDLEYYKAKLISLKTETHLFKYHWLDLYKGFNNHIYDVSFSDEYVFYSPRCGHRISTLAYNGQRIWTTKNKERCVGVCAYQGGNYYMLKLLLTNDNKSEMVLYYKLDNTFVKVDSIDVRKTFDDKNEYFINSNGHTTRIDETHGKLALQPPYDFYYPNYDFTPKYDEIDFTHPLDKYEPLFDLNKVYYDPLQKSYMDNFLMPLYPSKDCVWVDVANIDKTVSTFKIVYFDGVLKVGYVEPLPGKYFSEVTENGVKLYSKKSPNEACIGVTFYMGKGAMMLADVLIANSRPASIHLQKYKGKWSYVNKEKFVELLERFKKVQRKLDI